jgi:hypothetical protein
MPTSTYPRSEEHRKMMSEIIKNKWQDPDYIRKQNNRTLYFPKSAIRKSCEARRGKPLSKEHRDKISASHRKLNSEETRKKISKSLKGRKLTPKWKENLSNSRKGRFAGEDSPTWKGGISFEPYCPKFNRDFKNRVRSFFGNKCVECGKTKKENGKELAVHHVNYNKMMCCNNITPLFVVLCLSHNSKANKEREWWEQHFTEIIKVQYGGKCYFTIEEMLAFEKGDIKYNNDASQHIKS